MNASVREEMGYNRIDGEWSGKWGKISITPVYRDNPLLETPRYKVVGSIANPETGKSLELGGMEFSPEKAMDLKNIVLSGQKTETAGEGEEKMDETSVSNPPPGGGRENLPSPVHPVLSRLTESLHEMAIADVFVASQIHALREIRSESNPGHRLTMAEESLKQEMDRRHEAVSKHKDLRSDIRREMKSMKPDEKIQFLLMMANHLEKMAAEGEKRMAEYGKRQKTISPEMDVTGKEGLKNAIDVAKTIRIDKEAEFLTGMAENMVGKQKETAQALKKGAKDYAGSQEKLKENKAKAKYSTQKLGEKLRTILDQSPVRGPGFHV
jgi:hypothetical protein